jgi:hypothetical protein
MMALTRCSPPEVDMIIAGVVGSVDTSAKHAKLTYTVKNLVADICLIRVCSDCPGAQLGKFSAHAI